MGPLLDHNSYCMIASCQWHLYCLNAIVTCSLLTSWCTSKGKRPDTQFGFYLGQPMLKPQWLHAAFINLTLTKAGI